MWTIHIFHLSCFILIYCEYFSSTWWQFSQHCGPTPCASASYKFFYVPPPQFPHSPGNNVLHSHWSSSNETRLWLVESFREMLAPAILCLKDSWLPCTERSFYYVSKMNPNGDIFRSKAKPLVWGFGCDDLVLYGIILLAYATLWTSRPMRAELRWSSTNESGEHWVQVVLGLYHGNGNNIVFKY